MPVVAVNGINLSYHVEGDGDLVVLVMGTGSPGRVWHPHQVPALRAAGFRVATLDNRGIAPTDECGSGMVIEDLVGDTAALIEHLGGGPARVVGTSMGARVAQELALARPDLVDRAVLLATAGRNDPVQNALSQGERALHDKGITLPGRYYAAVTAVFNLSPKTMRDPVAVSDWLDVFEFSGSAVGPGVRAQMDMNEFDNRLDAYRAITRPCLVVGFADDRVLPPHLAREVADAIPGARYEEVADAGHYGFLEQPAEVNRLLLEFLKG
ncbi:alpha/beta hydrolase [Actinosynnema sp. NPDC047251]|uniref:Alpha/beta hydrolase fold containing protein n=1 Tax=Saccharothrix espanaensis (strain ATCC 51144 / DSM 44229 / JCM 9112 / NBRC 15066 / NRRL 15764) TaxID=1179773 RepID=K0KBE5_SACES|nr:alpha/beta hydrolase [Saccharothrix espanaensis]CCH33963.1 alpha/beta hydrolase fold containing protein [Saccharothrix espanaensis DSM 44229]